jgi:iron complex outermembrane receptor protein
MGLKGYALKGKLYVELDGFYFKLNNALVVRKDSSNADYYVNAGNIKQKGLEATTTYNQFFASSIVHHLMLNAAYTFSDFKYGSFQKNNISYEGKRVPGVPQHSLSIQAEIQSKNGLYLRANCYIASTIYLDDANDASADPYQLVGMRIGYLLTHHSKAKINFYIGADNLLDQSYSLGNDINAAAGRYYNAAAKRNYYFGIGLSFK